MVDRRRAAVLRTPALNRYRAWLPDARLGARLLGFLIVAAFASAAICLRLAGTGPAQIGWSWFLPGCGFFFLPGMILAVVGIDWHRWSGRLPPLAHQPATWLTCSAILWILSALDGSYTVLLAGPASFLVIGACVLPLRPSRAVNALRWEPLAGLGIVSYSFYIWHKPLIEEVHRATGITSTLGLCLLAAPLAVAVGAVSYAIIESPLLRVRRNWMLSPTPKGLEQLGDEAAATDQRDQGIANQEDVLALPAGTGWDSYHHPRGAKSRS